MTEDLKDIARKILESDLNSLEWQFSIDDPSEVELLYWDGENEELKNYVLILGYEHINKDAIDSSTYWDDGMQQNRKEATVNIKDENSSFDIQDIVVSFENALSQKRIRKNLRIEKIN